MKKILMFNWNVFGKEDIIECYNKLGYNVVSVDTNKIMDRTNPEFDTLFDSYMKEKYDYVFSINYFPIVSNNCKKHNIKYISVVYDSPLVSLYSYSILNDCNYIFIFDSSLYNEFKNGGINTVYYMPLAVNIDRLDNMTCSEDAAEKLKCDVSFLGSMYDEKYNFFDRLNNLSEYTKGYLDGIMQAQLKVYGYYFIDELLTGDILKELEEKMPYTHNKD